MTFNIFHDNSSEDRDIPGWDGRRDHVVETISFAKADIVGLQEAFLSQVEYITGKLPQYSSVAMGRQATGYSRDETVAILYDNTKFDLLDSGHFWYSVLPGLPGSSWVGTDPPRMATWIRVRKKGATGKAFYVFNTHLASGDTGGAESRAESVRLLEAQIADREHPLEYFFITGDLNATDEEYPVRFLTGASELCNIVFISGCIPITQSRIPVIDSWRAMHSEAGGTRCSNAEPTSDGSRIDYIFVWDPTRSSVPSEADTLVPPEVDASDVFRFHSCPSDHRPTKARFFIPIE